MVNHASSLPPSLFLPGLANNLLLFPYSVLGTTIVVLRNPRHIVVGADSLVIYECIGTKHKWKMFAAEPTRFAIAGTHRDEKSNCFALGGPLNPPRSPRVLRGKNSKKTGAVTSPSASC